MSINGSGEKKAGEPESHGFLHYLAQAGNPAADLEKFNERLRAQTLRANATARRYAIAKMHWWYALWLLTAGGAFALVCLGFRLLGIHL